MENPLVTCPHCNQEFVSNSIKRHAKTCMSNPEIRDRLIEVVTSYAVDGIAPSFTDYGTISKMHGLPNIKKIVSTFGGYINFVESIGLIGNRPTLDVDSDIAEAQRLSLELYDGTIGPCPRDWAEFAEIHITLSMIQKSYPGGFDKLLADAGLTRNPRGFYDDIHYRKQGEWKEITKPGAVRLKLAESKQAEARAMPFPLKAIDRGIRTWFDSMTHTRVTAHVLELR